MTIIIIIDMEALLHQLLGNKKMTNIPRKDNLFVDMTLPDTLYQTATPQNKQFLDTVAQVLQWSKKHQKISVTLHE